MAQVVNTNYASLQAQNQLNQTNGGLKTSLARLSSGLRINSAKDDAAGLAVAERFTAQIRGFNQGSRNAADAISMTQTAEGAMGEMQNNVQRIRELAIQARNGTYSTSDRSALNTEVIQLKQELFRIANNTRFNDVNLFDDATNATAGTTIFQVGADNAVTDRISIQIGQFANTAADGGGSAGLRFQQLVGTTADGKVAAGVDNTAVDGIGGNILTAEAADAMITKADNLLDVINNQRANLGAIQNRFESVIRSADIASANMADSRSRIQDTDFASETANLTKMQILQQAGISVLSQANSMPQSALSLLG